MRNTDISDYRIASKILSYFSCKLMIEQARGENKTSTYREGLI